MWSASPLALLALAGCGLSVRPAACESHAACRDAFGVGMVCGEAGFCEPATLPDRCVTWPEDALANPSPDDPTIVLGAQYDFQADYIELLASQLAFQQVNERTGLDGRDFALVACDSSEDPAIDDLDNIEATELISRLQGEVLGLPAIVGAEFSSRAEAAYAILAPLGTLIISPGASSPSLTTIDGLNPTDDEPGLFWRTIPPDTDQARVAAREIDENLGGGEVAIIAQTGAYGEGFAQVFLEAYDPGNTRTHLRLFANDTDLSTAIVEVGEEAPDVVLFITGEPAVAVDFLDAAAALPAYADVPIVLTDGPKTSELLDTIGAGATLLPQVRGTFPRAPTQRSTYTIFATSFRLAFDGFNPDDDSYTPYCYDAGWLAIYGAAWATWQEGGISGLGMARGLRRLSDGVDVDVGPGTWSTVQSAFRAGDGVDVNGASGSLDFDPATGETSAAVDVWFVADDGFSTGYCWDLSGTPDPACTGAPAP